MIYGVKNLPTKDLSTIYLMELDYKKPEVKRKLKNKIDKNIDLKKKKTDGFHSYFEGGNDSLVSAWERVGPRNDLQQVMKKMYQQTTMNCT